MKSRIVIIYDYATAPDVIATAVLKESLSDTHETWSHALFKAGCFEGALFTISKITTHLFVFGSFWNSELHRIPSDVKITVYSYEDSQSEKSKRSNLEFICSNDKTVDPLEAVGQYVSKEFPECRGCYEKLMTDVNWLELVRNRSFCQEIDTENIEFFTGFYDHSSNNLETAISLVRKEITKEQLQNNGSILAKNQRVLINDRVHYFSRVRTLEGGTILAVGPAPEFVNLMHEALKTRYPYIDYTLTYNLVLTADDSKVSFSVRSVNPEKSALTFANTLDPTANGTDQEAVGNISLKSFPF